MDDLILDICIAFQEGQAAFMKGIKDNPWLEGSYQHGAWKYGFKLQSDISKEQK